MRKKSQLFNGDHDGGGLDDMIKHIEYILLLSELDGESPASMQ